MGQRAPRSPATVRPWTALPGPVCSTRPPDIVRRVHEDYIRAGADIITANTFATHRHVFNGAGLGDESVDITRRGIELALEARDRVAPERPVAVAGSISTMLAWTPGTVSAEPRHIPSPEQESANFREMADTLAEGGVDFIIMEMMLDLERATRAIDAAVATGLPVWIGISCTRHPDGRLIGWDSAAESLRLAEDHRPRPEIPLETLLEELLALGGSVAGIMHSTVASTSPALVCDNLLSDVVLQSQNFSPLSIILLYPKVTATDSVDQLRGHPHPVI